MVKGGAGGGGPRAGRPEPGLEESAGSRADNHTRRNGADGTPAAEQGWRMDVVEMTGRGTDGLGTETGTRVNGNTELEESRGYSNGPGK